MAITAVITAFTRLTLQSSQATKSAIHLTGSSANSTEAASTRNSTEAASTTRNSTEARFKDLATASSWWALPTTSSWALSG